MFYTKYRPQKFSDISRPNQAADALATQVTKDKVAHAYLFVGPRGTGKTTTARILAKSLNCTNLQSNGDPCGECAACTGIINNSYIDLIEIDAASNRGIDDIRDLKDKINLAPAAGKKKIYIIDEVHMLTNEAFNALLKTLEEPPKHVHFVLCTTEVHKVPDTIKSRCQVFRFKRASVKQLVDKLSVIAKDEGAKVSKKDLEKIARAAYGGFRDAETMLEQVVEGGIDVDTFLESAVSANYEQFVRLLLAGDCKDAISLVNDLYTAGVDLYYWCGSLLGYLRDLLLLKSGVPGDEDFSDIEELSVGQAVRLLQAFSSIHNDIKTAFIPQLPLEISILSLCEQTTTTQQPNIEIQPAVKPEPVTRETKPKQSKKSRLSVELETVLQKWQDVVEAAFALNASVSGLLKNASPVSISGSALVLEVYFPFHMERLKSQRNSEIVEQALAQVYGEPMSIQCVLGENRPASLKSSNVAGLTDLNVSVPGSAEPVSTDDLISMLDGSLPL